MFPELSAVPLLITLYINLKAAQKKSAFNVKPAQV